MKTFQMAVLVFGAVSLCACHKIRLQDSRNGVPVSTLSADVTPFSADVSTNERSDPAMTKCLAEIGPMEGGEEHQLCAERMRTDEARRTRQHDRPAYPYYQTYPYPGPYPYGYPPRSGYVMY